MTDASFGVLSPPDPVKANQWAGQIRALIALLVGAGIVGGAWTGVTVEQITNWVTLAMWAAAAAGAAFTSYKSWRAHAEERAVTVASSIASAQHGTPVVVTVTPEGQPNIVTTISPAEQAAAPSVPNVIPQPAPKS